MSNPKAPKNKDAGRKHFSAKEYKLMCDWLEIDGNLQSILGSKRKTKVGGQYHSKKLAFDAMAQYINNRSNKGSNLAKVDFQGAKNRFNHLNAKYKRVKQMSEVTGFGVTISDEADGIHSIAAKLEKLCPCFDRLDSIFGNNLKVDTQSNLYFSPLLEEVHGRTPDDFLTQHNTTRHVSIVNHHDPCDIVEVGDRGVTHVSLEAEMPITLVESIPHIESIGRPCFRAETPPLERQALNCQDSSSQSKGGTRPESSKSKQKVHRGSTSHVEKRSIERNLGLTSTFAQSMEMPVERNVRSLKMKERVLEHKAPTPAIQAKMTHQELTFFQQQLDLEGQRICLEEKKLEQDAQAKEVELAQRKRACKVQARILLIMTNAHRPPHELAEIIAMVENGD